MDLYLVTTSGLGSFYVVANHPTEAQEKLSTKFSKINYGFQSDRKVLKIEFVTSVLENVFDSEHSLIL